MLNTASIERLNGTFRSRLAVLGWRTRRSARRRSTVVGGMYLVGTVYNFCTLHASLTSADGRGQTLAMAAALTDHVWAIVEEDTVLLDSGERRRNQSWWLGCHDRHRRWLQGYRLYRCFGR